MIEKLLRIRFVYLITVVITFINSLFFLYNGVRAAIHGYDEMLRGVEGAGLHFVESLDAFMISLVFMIFSLGIMRIFTHYHTNDSVLPEWLRIKSFLELKILLWETILVTLVVFSISHLLTNLHNLTWNALILPSVIFILSASLYVMRKH